VTAEPELEILIDGRIDYNRTMSETGQLDPLVANNLTSSNEEFVLDEETATAVDAGIRAADEGRLIASDEVRRLVKVWISRSSTPLRP
jgi:hypothetical protein